MLLKRGVPIDCFVSFLLVMGDQSAHPFRMLPDGALRATRCTCDTPSA